MAKEGVGILEKSQRAFTSALNKPGPLSWRYDMAQVTGLWVVNQPGMNGPGIEWLMQEAGRRREKAEAMAAMI